MRVIVCILLGLNFSPVAAQPNCWAFLHYGDTLKYEACLKAEEVEGYYQFSKEYQMILDEALNIDSTFAYAYTRKSVAYLKSGDFITWKRLIDQAVKFDPQEYLGHRGYIRYKCFRDYKGAIKDIEKLDSLVKLDIGYTAIGKDHLVEARAMCYKSIGQEEKAIRIMEEQLSGEGDFGTTEYLHLGVLYLGQNEYEKALSAFAEQSKVHELAENHYYLAMTYKALKMDADYEEHLREAKRLFLADVKLFDIYIDPMDKIYLSTIEDELEAATTRNRGH